MIVFNVKGMICGQCVRTIKTLIKALDPQAEIEVDLAGRLVHITSCQPPDVLANLINELDYLALPL